MALLPGVVGGTHQHGLVAPLVAGVHHFRIAAHDIDGHTRQRIEHAGIVTAKAGFDERLRNAVQLEAVDADQGIGESLRQLVLQSHLHAARHRRAYGLDQTLCVVALRSVGSIGQVVASCCISFSARASA